MSAARSKSVPASRTINREVESPDESSPFPPLPSEPSGDLRIPSWVQELANTRAGRHSRASSIVSTRTRFSTTTFDDARSIDIQAGGQTFRISRFGDRVTDTTAPPPYPGPNENDIFGHTRETTQPEDTSDEHFQVNVSHRRHYHHGHRGGRHSRRVRIAMPDEDGTEIPPDDDSIASDTPSRVITDDELRQIITDLPSRLKTALGIDPDRFEASKGDSPEDNTTNAVIPQPPGDEEQATSMSTSTVGSSSTQAFKPANSSQVRGILRNAPEHAPYHSDSCPLPNKGSRWMFAKETFAQRLWNTYANAKLSSSNEVSFDGEGGSNRSAQVPEEFHATESSSVDDVLGQPTVGDLNELSQVYNKVIRDLDREHRKQLHERDKELDQLRILLHEKDIVYRQQLKGKDFVIDDLKHRLDRFEETMELKVEKAIHNTEDRWEERWQEHSKQLMEKCGLIKPVLQTYATTATQTDDD